MKLGEALKRGKGKATRGNRTCGCHVQRYGGKLIYHKGEGCLTMLDWLVYDLDATDWRPFEPEPEKCPACLAAQKITETSHGSNLMRIHLTRTVAQGGHCTCK